MTTVLSPNDINFGNFKINAIKATEYECLLIDKLIAKVNKCLKKQIEKCGKKKVYCIFDWQRPDIAQAVVDIFRQKGWDSQLEINLPDEDDYIVITITEELFDEEGKKEDCNQDIKK